MSASRLLSLVGTTAIVLVLIVFPRVLFSPVTATGASCITGEQAAKFGVALTQLTSANDASAKAAASTDLGLRHPGADVTDQIAAHVGAPLFPPLDSRDALVVTFWSPEMIESAGPVDARVGPFRVGCGLAFYDPKTGAFIGDLLQLEDPGN